MYPFSCPKKIKLKDLMIKLLTCTNLRCTKKILLMMVEIWTKWNYIDNKFKPIWRNWDPIWNLLLPSLLWLEVETILFWRNRKTNRSISLTSKELLMIFLILKFKTTRKRKMLSLRESLMNLLTITIKITRPLLRMIKVCNTMMMLLRISKKFRVLKIVKLCKIWLSYPLGNMYLSLWWNWIDLIIIVHRENVTFNLIYLIFRY